MIRVEISTTIDRPAGAVFAYIDDLSRMPEWIDVIERSVPSEAPTRVGTVVTNNIHLLRRHFQNQLEVTEHVPAQRLTLHTSEPFEVRASFVIEPDGPSATLTVLFEAQPNAGAFFRLSEPILTRVAARRFKGHLGRAKRRIEDASGVLGHAG
jgi:uncharacterized membrane protein